MDFLSERQLIEGMLAWTLVKSQSLGEILKNKRILSPDRCSVLERLVDTHVEQHGGDAKQSIQAISSPGSIAEQLRSLGDADVEASLELLPVHDVGSRSSVEPPNDVNATANQETIVEPPSSGLRFTILRVHDEGNLGKVSIAIDRELNREVAFKEIRSDRFNHESRQRFIREAEITGRLEHPGVVPVYSLGQFNDGRPFYAMRFIRGVNFQEAIVEFHDRRCGLRGPIDRTPYPRDLGFRGLLRRFNDVCNAIEYAHSRGVLHRDLKPVNIMLGEYGETLVVDWELAKAAGRTRIVNDNIRIEDVGEKSLVPSLESSGHETQAGARLGTPMFMSPEQARGEIDELGTATDTYSLGATLYQILTSSPPIGATKYGNDSEQLSVPDVIRRVTAGDFPRPRTVNSAVPPALEAICLKAMALVPSDRYATAKELSDDIKAWMAGEPVLAWKEPVHFRANRWIRNHRAFASGTLVTVLILAVLGPLFGLQQAQQREIAENARGVAEQQTYFSVMRETEREWNESNIGSLKDGLKMYANQFELQGFEWHYWENLCNSDRLKLVGHKNSISDAVFSPDGTLIATASADGTVKLWNTRSGKEVRSFTQHTQTVNSVAFCPILNHLASTGNDGTVKLWDIETGELIHSHAEHRGVVSMVAFHPDGKRLVSAGRDGAAIILNCESFETSKFQLSNSPLTAVAFSRSHLAIAAEDNTVVLWDTDKKMEIHRFEGSPIPRRLVYFTDVAFSPDGTQLAASSFDFTVKLWDVATHTELRTFKGHTNYVVAVTFSHDGRKLASCDADNSIRIWDIENGEQNLVLRGHTGERIMGVDFSPDDQELVSAGTDGTAQLWDAVNGQQPLTMSSKFETDLFPGEISSIRTVAFSQDGKWLATASWGNSIRICNVQTLQTVLSLKGHEGRVTSVVFSSDGTRLASVSRESEKSNLINVWDSLSGTIVCSLREHVQTPAGFYVPAIALSPNGKRVASAGSDHTVKIWNVESLRAIHTLQHEGIVEGVAFSPDGKRLASGGWDKNVKIWNAQNGQLICTIPDADRSFVRSLAFSSDSKRLASCGVDRSFKVWDVTTGEIVHIVNGHNESVLSVAFSPDGRRMASAGNDDTVKVWDTETGQRLLTLKGHTDDIQCVVFSHDGRRLASASLDGTVKVWGGELPARSIEVRYDDFERARGYLRLGYRQRKKNQDEEAASSFRDAVEICEQLNRQESNKPKVWDTLAESLRRLGTLYKQTDASESQRSYEWAIRAYSQTISIREKHASETSTPSFSARLDDSRFWREWTRIKINQHELAASQTKKLSNQQDVSDDMLYNLACILSLASEAASEDTRLTDAKRKSMADKNAVSAIMLLNQLQEKGYFKGPILKHMKSVDRDLDPIRGRDDFQELIRRIESAPKSGK